MLISVDTLRADRVGAYGRSPSITPAMDSLAERGATYLEVRAAVPLTLPSHSVMMTGKLPIELGVRDNSVFRLGPSHETLAEAFSRAGYRCAAFVGSYVLSRQYGLDQGFEVYDDEMPEGGPIATGERRAAEVVSRAKRWLDGVGKNRFFLFVHLFDPHSPYGAPQPWASRHANSYDAEVAYADSEVGDLLAHMRRLGLEGRVAVAFVGDHGELLGEHGESGHGVFLYEAALRVPMILVAPGRIPAGQRIEGPARLLDLYATVRTLMGLGEGGGPAKAVEGRALWPLEAGRKALDDVPTYAETMYPYMGFRWSGSQAIIQSGRKYILSARPELYDLAADPGEARDLIASDPAATQAMREALLDLIRSAPAAGPRPGHAPDPEIAERLRSLGYVGGSAGSGLDSLEERLRLPDPKDKVPFLARYDVAVARLLRRDTAGGMRILEDLAREDPGNLTVLMSLAAVKFGAGDLRGAVDTAHQALRLDPSRADIRAGLAKALAKMGRDDEALAQADQALAADPALTTALRVRAAIHVRRGNPEAALRDLRGASSLRPGTSQPEVDLAELLMQNGDSKRAISTVEGVLASNPRDSKALALRGHIRARLGDISAARRDFAAAVEADPSSFYALFMLAAAEAEQGDLPEALVHYEKALAAGGESPEVLNAYAASLIRAGQADRARQALLRSEQIRPGQPAVRALLGKAEAARP